MPRPILARGKRAPPILICAKCVRRAPDGKAIRKALKARLADRDWMGGKAPKLVPTKCLGICPKRALTLVNGKMLATGHFLVLKDKDEAAEALDLLAGG